MLFVLSQFLTQSLLRLLFKFTKNKKIAVSLFFCLFFPGIVIHELAHLFTARLLFVRTGRMVLFPKIVEDEVRLGSVDVEKTDPFRRLLIGVAPVLFGLALVFGILFYLQPLAVKNLALYVLLIYVIFAIGNTLFSSKKDLEGVVEFLLAAILFALAIFILRPEAVRAVFGILQKPEIANFFKSADLLLIVPILLDLVIMIFVRLLVSKG
jgi:hypothetical protein